MTHEELKHITKIIRIFYLKKISLFIPVAGRVKVNKYKYKY